MRDCGADAEWRCNPILDIDTAGRAVHCFPLANLRSEPVRSNSTASELRAKFSRAVARTSPGGIRAACRGCGWKESGACRGGCPAVAREMSRQSGC